MVATLALPAASPRESVFGLWLAERKDGIFRFEACPDGLCAVLVGLKPNRKADGKLDPACGMNLFRAMKWNDGKSQWEGRIVDPRTGKDYGAIVRAPAGETMRLRFYAGISLIGSSETWMRYTGEVRPECAMN
jgi:uncharacterized protein (DUF2147 family)